MKIVAAIITRVYSVAVVVFGAMGLSYPSVAATISQDEITVYKTVLASWFDGRPQQQLVDYHLAAPPSAADPALLECTKALHFAGNSPPDQNQKSLVGADFEGSGVTLIDGSRWNPNDPGRAIANGELVGAAVNDGIAHSLISFSQIAFSDDGKDALVKFSMVCGHLCGTGSTIHLHKSETEWKVINRCSGWIS
ncbi:MAG TPA: hypothetical protein VHL34_20565 [Rhizomicrobium sp.]|jgi:hypothetical protein|nr:hypothetical protein [Rhizomicrobium sp.]